MRTSRAKPVAAATYGAAAVERALQAAIAAAAEQLAATEQSCLASLSVALDPAAVAADGVFGGDSRWSSPNDDLSLYGFGIAARFERDAAARFEAERARWRLLGTDDAVPLAFFTAPPATAAVVPALWVPRVLLRRHRDALVVTLTARRDGTPPQEIARAWLRDATRLFAPEAGGSAPCELLDVTTTPASDEWRQRVRAARQAIAAGHFAKVVLSRRLDARVANAPDPSALAERLARSHPECHVFSLPYGGGQVVAASPEQLAAKRGDRLVSHALAGTAKRHETPDDDARAATALLASEKERHEHAIVVDDIAARMAEICTAVEHPQAPSVMRLRFVQHLWTPVAGRLKDGIGLLDAVAHLHPTPAVLGLPRQATRDWLGQIGEHRDGLYSGVAGWIDLAGDGDAVVVLRAAYIEESRAVLWAGAGIMADSDAEAELAETELKLATMLEVLNAS